MKIDICTIFPAFFESPLQTSFFRRASEAHAWQLGIHDLRDYAEVGVHRATDDTPYGGGPGMVMLLDPIVRCLEALTGLTFDPTDPPPANPKRVIALLAAAGTPFTQATAARYASLDRLILICGHYEGVDERLTQLVPLEELSIGDYVLTGGESAALVVLDSMVRLLPEVLGNPESLREESFQTGLLDHPGYTRPAEYRGLQVPEVLLSGHHARVARWRRDQALLKTARTRPDLLVAAQVSEAERQWLARVLESEGAEDEGSQPPSE